MKPFPEDFLYFLWRFKRFDFNDLRTTTGEAITLIALGEYNTHAGPDFLNAKIKIGDTLWAGNVEMHLFASDWLKHKHQEDAAYENVILHVVYEADEVIKYKDGTAIPALELRKRIPSNLLSQYLKLLHNEYWIPCQHQFHNVSDFTKSLWYDRLLIERLEEKTKAIKMALDRNTGDWEETFYQFMARNFGLKVNAEPFEHLARSLPHITLAKHKNSLFQLEALLFGQAGLLSEEFDDDYPNQLKKEYQFLKTKHQLTPIPVASWRFLRLRPANFPTIRLAQFATLVYQSTHLFSKILKINTFKEIEELLKVQLSDYWLTHYTFDSESDKRNKSLGKTTIRLIIINTIVPFLFLYGKETANDDYKDKALQLLEELPAEKNSIINKWKDLGVVSSSAYHTQALLQLKNVYCSKSRCLECSVGNALLKK